MKNILKVIALTFCLLLPSCIYDEPDYSTEVIKIENTLISYYDIDGNHWYCREALINAYGQLRDVKFPIEYECEIIQGTKIEWHCYLVTSYHKNGKKILIDWGNTKK